MLYVISGTDFEQKRRKKDALVAAMQKRRKDAEVITFTEESFSRDALEESVGSQGLFERKNIVVLDGVLSSKEGKEVIDKAETLQESDNAFILLDTLDARALKKLQGIAQDTFLFGEKSSSKPSFALTNALAARDRKGVWVEYHKALFEGRAPEEIHGLLFWQIKSLLLASASATAEEAGMKAFPFKRAKSALKNYSPEELRDLSRKMVGVYHRAHLGEEDLSRGLEKILLTL